MADVKIRIDDKQMMRNFKKLRATLPKVVDKEILATANFGIQIIQDRTEKGMSFEGYGFKPYTKSYAGFRAKKGRKTAPPDLNFSGTMLSSMVAKPLPDSKAKITFSRAAEYKKAAFNQELRPFVGFNSGEEGRLARFFQKRIEKHLGRVAK